MTAQQGRQVTHARRAFRDGGGDGNESERQWTWVFGMADFFTWRVAMAERKGLLVA